MNSQERLIRISARFNTNDVAVDEGFDEIFIDSEDLDGLEGLWIDGSPHFEVGSMRVPLIEFNVLQVADRDPRGAELWLQEEAPDTYIDSAVSDIERPSDEWTEAYAEAVEELSRRFDGDDLLEAWRSVRAEIPELQEGWKLRLSDPTVVDDDENDVELETEQTTPNSAADW